MYELVREVVEDMKLVKEDRNELGSSEIAKNLEGIALIVLVRHAWLKFGGHLAGTAGCPEIDHHPRDNRDGIRTACQCLHSL